MKNSYLYTIAIISVLLSLVSCSENDLISVDRSSDKYIVFGYPTINLDATIGDFADNYNTRGQLATSVDEFTVWAYCTANNISDNTQSEGTSAARWNDKSKFFTGNADGGADVANLAKSTVNPSKNNYNGGNLTPWKDDNNARYTFIGATGNATYSMEKASPVTGNSHGPRLTITLPTSSKSVLDRKQQPDIMVAAAFDHQHEDGNVKFSFFHIMTALRFKFHNHSDKDLIIKKMTFKGTFHKEAVLDFTTTNPVMTVTSNKYTGSFSIIDTEQEIPHGSADFAGGDTDPSYLILLPNPEGTTDNNDGKFVLGSNKSIDIYYRFADDKEGQEDRHFTTDDNFTLNYLPQPNTLHTAHFNFIGDNFTISFQAEDKNWDNGSDNKYTIK